MNWIGGLRYTLRKLGSDPGPTVVTLLTLALMRLLASEVFGVETTDPLIYLGVTTILVLVAVAASLLPALRATRVDPCTVLRCE